MEQNIVFDVIAIILIPVVTILLIEFILPVVLMPFENGKFYYKKVESENNGEKYFEYHIYYYGNNLKQCIIPFETSNNNLKEKFMSSEDRELLSFINEYKIIVIEAIVGVLAMVLSIVAMSIFKENFFKDLFNNITVLLDSRYLSGFYIILFFVIIFSRIIVFIYKKELLESKIESLLLS